MITWPNIDFSTLSPKRQESLTIIGILFIVGLFGFAAYAIYTRGKKKKRYNLIALLSAFIIVASSFFLPIALNLSFQKDGAGSVLLQSMLTISGGLVVLFTYMENRRKNDIDESKNIDEKIQKLHDSRYERNIKSIELIFSEKTPTALSAVYSLCKIADDWVDDYINMGKKNNSSSKQEAQSIINVLCTYIREYGKASDSNGYKKEVCETIMEEICNRLNQSDNGYSDWSDFMFNFEGAIFTHPVIFKNVADINNINLNGCTFINNLEIYFSVEYNNQASSREVLINHCTFKGSVILAPGKFTRGGSIRAAVSNIALEDSHFAKDSKLEIKHLCPPDYDPEGDDSKNKGIELPIYVYGNLPANTSFRYIPQANIIVGQKYDSRDPGMSGAIQHTIIQGNIHINQCDNVIFEIPDKHIINGVVNINDPDISQYRQPISENLKNIKINDCILKNDVLIAGSEIDIINFLESTFHSSLKIMSRGRIGKLIAPDSQFLLNGSTNTREVPHGVMINSKSNVSVSANYIDLLELSGTHFYSYVDFQINKIKLLYSKDTIFHAGVNTSTNLKVEKFKSTGCRKYDYSKKKYILFKWPSINSPNPNSNQKIASAIAITSTISGMFSK